MSETIMLLSLLSDAGLIALLNLKPTWTEILPLIVLIEQLTNYGKLGSIFNDHIRSVFKCSFICWGESTSNASVG